MSDPAMNHLDGKMIVAALRGNVDLLRSYLSEGARPNIDLDRQGRTLLIYLAKTAVVIDVVEGVLVNRKEVMQVLLEAAADPNFGDADGMTPLHEIVGGEHFDADIAALLLKHKADINAPTENGTTPLHSAVYRALKSGDVKAIRFLLENGADRTVTNDAGKTALEIAVHFEKDEIVRCFLEIENRKKESSPVVVNDVTAANLNRVVQKRPVFHLKRRSP